MTLTSHKGVPHLTFRFDGATLVIPLCINEAWKTIVMATTASPEKSDALIALIKLCGRLQEFEFAAGSPLQTNSRSITDYIDVPLEELTPYLESGDPRLGRIASFLLLLKLHLFPDIQNLIAAVEYSDKEHLNSYKMLEVFQELLMSFSNHLPKQERPYFDKGMVAYCYGKTLPRYALGSQLIYLANDALFAKGIEWMGSTPFEDWAAIEHHLAHKRVAKVLALLQVLQVAGTGDSAIWKSITNRIADILALTAKSVTADKFAVLLDRAKTFSGIVFNTLSRFSVETDFLNETEKLEELFNALQLDAEANLIAVYRQGWKDKALREQNQRDIIAFKNEPDLERALKLLSLPKTEPSEVRSCFLEFIKKITKGQNAILRGLLQEETFLALFEGEEEKKQLMAALERYLSCCLNSKPLDGSTAHTILQLNLPYSLGVYIDSLSKLFALPDPYLKKQALEMIKIIKKEPYYYVGRNFSIYNLIMLKLELMSAPFDKDYIQALCVSHLFTMSTTATVERLLTLYKMLLDHPMSHSNFKCMFEVIFRVRCNLHPSKTPEAITQIVALDSIYGQLILNSYDPDFDKGIDVVRDIITCGGWSKAKHADFKKAILKAIEADNGRQGAMDPGLKKVFQALVKKLPENPKYAELIDEWVDISRKENLGTILLETIGNLSEFFPSYNGRQTS